MYGTSACFISFDLLWTTNTGVGLTQWLSGKESTCNAGFNHWVRKIPWKREWLPIPVFLPGEFHGQRSMVGYSPWGCKELDMTEWSDQHFHFFTSRLEGRSSGPGTKLGEERRHKINVLVTMGQRPEVLSKPPVLCKS